MALTLLFSFFFKTKSWVSRIRKKSLFKSDKGLKLFDILSK